MFEQVTNEKVVEVSGKECTNLHMKKLEVTDKKFDLRKEMKGDMESNMGLNKKVAKSAESEVKSCVKRKSSENLSLNKNNQSQYKIEIGEVNKSENKVSKKVINAKLSNSEVQLQRKLSEVKVEKGSNSEKMLSGIKNSWCINCGSFARIREDPILCMVDLFEHINASGSPNYALCRIPLPYSKLNISVWREKLSQYKDKIVCEFLQFGFPLDFNRNQKLSANERRNHKGARDFPRFIEKYLKRECDARRVIGPFHTNPLSVPLIVSPMNTVPKDSLDERRVIVDLSWPSGASVNDGISKDIYLGEIIHLHYASVDQVCNMVLQIGPGAHIYKRDLRHAYRQVPVDPGDFQYLGYFWDSMLYFDTVLAMGQRNAAMACSRTTDAIMYIHEQAGHSGTNYLDDLIGVANPDVSLVAYEHLGKTLQELGLLENVSKACPPAPIQIVLGIEINTVEGTIAVPKDKLHEIKVLVSEWQEKVKSTKVQLQSLIGKLQFISKCVLQSRVFMNRLLETLRAMSKTNSIKLSRSFMKDIKWWDLFVAEYNGVSFIPSITWDEPDATFATDSSLTGCGGTYSKQFFHASFPLAIRKKDLPIHKLEMLTVLLGVRIWGQHCAGMRIQIYCDNEACVHVINSSKTKDPFLATCLRELWLEVARFGFELRAVHLPGVQNRVPDWLSRWDSSQEYRDSFKNFMGDESDEYTEIEIMPEMFEFSGDL